MKNKKSLFRPFPKAPFLLLLLTLMIFGCVKTGVLQPGAQLNGYVFVRNDLGNLRFELAQSPGDPIIHPSENLRIHLGEQIRFKWDKFYGYWKRPEAMCTFTSTSVSTESCRICQDCNPTDSERLVEPCQHVNYGGGDISLLIAEYKNFVISDSNRRYVISGPSVAWLCPANLTHGPELVMGCCL